MSAGSGESAMVSTLLLLRQSCHGVRTRKAQRSAV